MVLALIARGHDRRVLLGDHEVGTPNEKLIVSSVASSVHYNFGRVHQTLRVTPAMEAGIADHVWSIEEIVGLLE